MGIEIQGRVQAAEELKGELQPGEKVLWAGKPSPGVRFGVIDVLAIPFGLYFGFGFFRMGWGDFPGLTLFHVPFMLIGLYVAFGRHLVNMLWKRGASYAVTDSRVIAVSTFRGRSVNSRPIRSNMTITKSIRRDGSGTIVFGVLDGGGTVAATIPSMLSKASLSVVAFIDIPEAERVWSLVNSVSEGKESELSEVEIIRQSAPMPDTPLPLTSGPRTVSLLARLRLVFGNALTAVGWVWFGFSMIFFWTFAMNADYSPLYFWTGAERSIGQVISAGGTGASVNGQSVKALKYSFTTTAGRTITGSSDAAGVSLKKGDKVDIEYWKPNPLKNRVKGAPSGMPYFVGLFVLIFPTVGLLLIVWGVRWGLRVVDLLARGEAAYAVLKSQSVRRSDDSRYFDMTFEFKTSTGATHITSVTVSDPRTLTDQARKMVLYLPDAPAKAQLVDAMPGKPQIDDSGIVRVRGIVAGIFGLLLAAGVLWINLRVLLNHLR